MKRLTAEQLADLKASNVGHASPKDLTDDTTFGEDPEIIAYLEHYAAPKKDADGKIRPERPCIACDATYSFTWGIAHGQGHCTGCGWPGTLYHYPTDKNGREVVIRGILLWAHPSEVEFRE